jgi:hypothetical protein
MKIDLCPITKKGKRLKYRGITRVFTLIDVKAKGRDYTKILNMYLKYLEWTNNNSYEYDDNIFNFLKELQTLLLNHNQACEILLFDDNGDSSIHNNVEFLGYDVVGDYFESPLQEGNIIERYFGNKLNDNGLFTNLEDATEFCSYWNDLISKKQSPWETDINPRPYYVWNMK